MSIALRYAIAIILAYLLGSLNFSIIISKLTLKKDIREYGSGNAGSTNSLRVMGIKKTVVVVLGDILKNVVAMLLVKPIMGSFDATAAEIFAGVACVLGHTYPIYFAFRGGKGVLSTASVVLCLDWRVCLIAVITFLIIVAVTRYVSLGSIIAVWTVPVFFYIFNGINGIEYVIFGAFLAMFVTILHRANIKRLAAGTENKLKFKK